MREPIGEMLKGFDAPIDISAAPAVWGGFVRGKDVIIRVGTSLSSTGSEESACDHVSAEIIENLSVVGGNPFFAIGLVIDGPLQNFQFEGALRALELAKQEGLCKNLALFALDVNAAISRWSLRDAFEIVFAPAEEFLRIVSFAKTRRVDSVSLGIASEDKMALVDIAKPEDFKALA
jgi:hypothetical protein